MDDFIKKSSSRTEELKELAEFFLTPIESEDNIRNTQPKKYNLELTVLFGTICRPIGAKNYDFGIESAIIKIDCINSKIPRMTWGTWPTINNFVETTNETSSAMTGDIATNRIGVSMNKGDKTSDKSKTSIIWPSGNEIKPIINFSVLNVSENILFGKYGPESIGILELGDNDSIIIKLLFVSTEIEIAKIDGKQVKPNLSKLILRFNPNLQQRIKEIKQELIGELQHVELQYIRN
jgi:hypothetical protein